MLLAVCTLLTFLPLYQDGIVSAGVDCPVSKRPLSLPQGMTLFFWLRIEPTPLPPDTRDAMDATKKKIKKCGLKLFKGEKLVITRIQHFPDFSFCLMKLCLKVKNVHKVTADIHVDQGPIPIVISKTVTAKGRGWKKCTKVCFDIPKQGIDNVVKVVLSFTKAVWGNVIRVKALHMDTCVDKD